MAPTLDRPFRIPPFLWTIFMRYGIAMKATRSGGGGVNCICFHTPKPWILHFTEQALGGGEPSALRRSVGRPSLTGRLGWAGGGGAASGPGGGGAGEARPGGTAMQLLLQVPCSWRQMGRDLPHQMRHLTMSLRHPPPGLLAQATIEAEAEGQVCMSRMSAGYVQNEPKIQKKWEPNCMSLPKANFRGPNVCI